MAASSDCATAFVFALAVPALAALVPVAPVVPAVVAAGGFDDSGFVAGFDAVAGFAGFDVLAVAAAGGIGLGAFSGLGALSGFGAFSGLGAFSEAVAEGDAAPPAAFSNSFRCVRNSTSLARSAGSS